MNILYQSENFFHPPLWVRSEHVVRPKAEQWGDELYFTCTFVYTRPNNFYIIAPTISLKKCHKLFIFTPLVRAKRARCEAEGQATGGELYFLPNLYILGLTFLKLALKSVHYHVTICLYTSSNN